MDFATNDGEETALVTQEIANGILLIKKCFWFWPNNKRITKNLPRKGKVKSIHLVKPILDRKSVIPEHQFGFKG